MRQSTPVRYSNALHFSALPRRMPAGTRPVVTRLLAAGLLAIILLVSGCAPAGESVSDLPTLVEFPTEAPSDTPVPVTPSATVPEASNTPEASSTPSATFTPSLTATITPSITPSRTVAPSNTPRPQPTATFTLTPTFTPLPFTSTPEATVATPGITSFTASTQTASAGASVTLNWEAVGDIARIDRINQLGQVVQTFSVTPSGQLPITVPANEGSTITFRLAVTRGNQEVTATLTIAVTGGSVACPINWFFGNEFAPADAGCPAAAPTTVNGAYQPFQTGRMIYLSSTNTVYALIDPGNVTEGTMTSPANLWNGTDTYTSLSCGSPPPTGLFEPQQMFAWVYCLTLAPTGLWNNALGFATAPIDNSQRTVQADSNGTLYADIPGGSVYRLVPVPTGLLSSTWKKIK